MQQISCRYEIVERIGKGGMGEVFRGYLLGEHGVRRPVAIKRAHGEQPPGSDSAERFAREARLCAELQHPNIISVFGFVCDKQGRAVLVMELVDGIDTAELLQRVQARGPLSVGVAAHIVVELLRGLAHAHAHSIVHRDISPHNVLLSRDGGVKLSDFGIARCAEASGLTAPHVLIGKPPYISPEQIEGWDVKGRADLFAVGVMLYELLTGRLPFGDCARVVEAVAQTLYEPITPPAEIRPELPPELCRIVLRLLARDPKQRYQTAEEVLCDLLPFASGADELASLLRELLPPPQDTRQTGARAPAQDCAPTRPWRHFLVPVAAAALLASSAAVVKLRGRGEHAHKVPSAAVAPGEDTAALVDAEADSHWLQSDGVNRVGFEGAPVTSPSNHAGRPISPSSRERRAERRPARAWNTSQQHARAWNGARR